MTHMITCLFTSHRLPSTSAHRSQQAASANSAELGCGHKNGVMMMVIHTNERRDPLQRVRDESVPIGGLWGGNEACSRRPPDPPSPHPVCMLASLPPVECGFIQHVPHRQVTVALWRGVHGESEQDVPHYPTPKLLSRVGFLERAHRVRRGEGGWEGRGGPLWSPAVPLCDVHPPCRQPYRATRATIKAHSTHPHRPRPYGSGSFVGGSPQKNLPVKAAWGPPDRLLQVTLRPPQQSRRRGPRPGFPRTGCH